MWPIVLSSSSFVMSDKASRNLRGQASDALACYIFARLIAGIPCSGSESPSGPILKRRERIWLLPAVRK